MSKVPEQEFFSLIKDFVKISEETSCPSCNRETKLVGEVRTTGNWICPWCMEYFPYSKSSFIVESPFTKLTDQFIPKAAQPKGSILLGDPDPNFPMNTTTQYLVPSYSYKIKRKRNVLLAVMDDGSRTGRDKSLNLWLFDLIWNERPRAEYETLITFADERAYHKAFVYYDVFRKSTHSCYFDSDVSDASVDSFDNCSFSVRITE